MATTRNTLSIKRHNDGDGGGRVGGGRGGGEKYNAVGNDNYKV